MAQVKLGGRQIEPQKNVISTCSLMAVVFTLVIFNGRIKTTHGEVLYSLFFSYLEKKKEPKGHIEFVDKLNPSQTTSESVQSPLSLKAISSLMKWRTSGLQPSITPAVTQYEFPALSRPPTFPAPHPALPPPMPRCRRHCQFLQ